MTQNHPTRLITRPKLCGFLMAHGYHPKPCPNPWRPELKAWTVEKTVETDALISLFYDRLKEGGRDE